LRLWRILLNSGGFVAFGVIAPAAVLILVGIGVGGFINRFANRFSGFLFRFADGSVLGSVFYGFTQPFAKLRLRRTAYEQ
jgi:hypothetical protein